MKEKHYLSRALKESYATVHLQVQKLVSMSKKELQTLEESRLKRIENGRTVYLSAIEKVRFCCYTCLASVVF